jgi:hypothetical protein
MEDEHPMKMTANGMPLLVCVIAGKNHPAVAKPANFSAKQLKYEKSGVVVLGPKASFLNRHA